MFWLDVLRGVIAFVCLVSIAIMVDSFIKYHDYWNSKTRDYWYARVMWTVGGVAGSIEGIVRGIPMKYSYVIVVAASLTTLKGNLKKGRWGGVRE